MKRRPNGSIFPEAEIAVLRSVYSLTKENLEIYYHPQVIAIRVPENTLFGRVNTSDDVYKLIEKWVDNQLVQEVKIGHQPFPEWYDTKPIRGYRANLEKEKDIRKKLRLR